MAEPRRSLPRVDQQLDQVAVAEEVDLLDAGGAVGDAGAGEQRVDGAAALAAAAPRWTPGRRGSASGR